MPLFNTAHLTKFSFLACSTLLMYSVTNVYLLHLNNMYLFLQKKMYFSGKLWKSVPA